MSKLESLFSKKAVILNLKAKTKHQALKEISHHLANKKFVSDETKILKALKKRESEFSTGLGEGIGIPHAQDDSVTKDVVLIAKSKEGIDWQASDKKPVHTIFSIILNSENKKNQTDVLQELSSLMMNKEQVGKIMSAKTIDATIKEALVKQKIETSTKVKKGAKKVVGVTSCPTGIAHTYMAADALKKAASDKGMSVKIETQGRHTENALSENDIKEADIVILAIDKKIEGLGRFNGKKVIKASTKKAINKADELIKDGLEGKGEISKAAKDESAMSSEISWASFKNVYSNLMGGVSRMLPFVVAGGILIGIAFLLDSGITGGNLGVTREISRWFAGLGKTVFAIFVPVLGAYVAYSIVGAEGLMPGLAAGLIASGGGILYSGDSTATGWTNLWGALTPGIEQDVLAAGSGFIGAMVGGYIAAATVVILRKYIFFRVSKTFQGIVSIIGVPVLSLLMTGAVMFAAQIPMVYLAYGLKLGLQNLADNDLLFIIGIIVGLMMAIDMGGPINKAAYVFATANLTTTGANAESSQIIMQAVMIAGMTPPLVIAFSTLVFGEKAYTKNSKEAGVANWLMGLFFITEGAIPFAARDPKRVIPVCMVSSAIAAGIVAALQVGVTAPHGGIFVFALVKSHFVSGTGMQIGLGIAFTLGALSVGTVLGGFTLGFWKSKSVKSGKLVLADR